MGLVEAYERCCTCWAMNAGGTCKHVDRRRCVAKVRIDGRWLYRTRRVTIAEIEHCPLGKGSISVCAHQIELREPM
jgi:hypothetical protein